jgi:hypothetical protein
MSYQTCVKCEQTFFAFDSLVRSHFCYLAIFNCSFSLYFSKHWPALSSLFLRQENLVSELINHACKALKIKKKLKSIN